MISTGTFSAVNDKSAILSLAFGATAEIILANTGGHAWQVDLEQMGSFDSTFARLASYSTDTASTIITNRNPEPLRLRLRAAVLDVADGDSVAYTLQDTIAVTDPRVRAVVFATGAKAGATSGWVVGETTDVGTLATLPKAKTAATLVIPCQGLKVGDRIVGAYLLGCLQASASHATGIDSVDLRKLTAAAAAPTDASVGSLLTLTLAVANTVLNAANTQISHVDSIVAANETYYLLVTFTTTNDDTSTAQLMAGALNIIPAA